MPTDKYESPEEFLHKMDAGELDGSLTTELKTLTRTQLEKLAQLLADRDLKKRSRKLL